MDTCNVMFIWITYINSEDSPIFSRNEKVHIFFKKFKINLFVVNINQILSLGRTKKKTQQLSVESVHNKFSFWERFYHIAS